MSFVNFRGRQSTYTPADSGVEVDEIKLWRAYVERPQYLAAGQEAA
jgi:hypothetical protein